MNYNKSFFGLLLAVLVLLPGCYHVPTYRSKSLQSVREIYVGSSEQNNVVVQARQLSESDKQFLFGPRAMDGIDILSLSVDNTSNCSYVAHLPQEIVPLSINEVMRLMKTSSIGGIARVGASAGGVGVACWSAAMIGKTSTLAIAPVVFGGALVLYVVSICAGLVFMGKTIKSIVMNGRLKKDLKTKIVPKKVIINPGQHYEGLVFVKSADYSPHFTVTLHEKNNKKNILTFDVDVQKSV